MGKHKDRAVSVGQEPPADAPLWTWIVHVDPFVRRLATATALLGIVVLALAGPLGVPLVLTGPALIRWGKPEAIASWMERRAVAAAIDDLEQRHVAGQLTDEAFGRRRAWLVSTAAV